jgi:hypothetical protein
LLIAIKVKRFKLKMLLRNDFNTMFFDIFAATAYKKWEENEVGFFLLRFPPM